MRFNALLRKHVCQVKDQLLRRIPARITHFSDVRSRLTAMQRIWATSARRVCDCEALCCREKKHVHCGPSILRFLTQASLPGGPFSRSLRCVVCTSGTAYCCACMLPNFFLHIFRIRVGDVFWQSAHVRHRSCRRCSVTVCAFPGPCV